VVTAYAIPSGLPSSATQMAIGDQHGCAIVAGEVECFGDVPHVGRGEAPQDDPSCLVTSDAGITYQLCPESVTWPAPSL
jgi:hypothetical protein